MATMRRLIEHLIELHCPIEEDGVIVDWCSSCEGQFLLPCETRQHAEEMLGMLNATDLWDWEGLMPLSGDLDRPRDGLWRLLPDPEAE